MAGAGPLHGKRVLITRPAEPDDGFAARLIAAGAEPIVAPTIAIGEPDDLDAARGAVARMHEYDWAVFTSRNGAAAFCARLDELGRGATGGVRVAAIGPATAAVLEAHGVRVDLVPPAFVNEAVAAELLERSRPGDRILVYRAQSAREVLPELLRAQGRVVDVVGAYATRLVDDPSLRTKASRADVVTFTSASTVRGFVRNVPDAAALLAPKVVAAIGPITAAAARDAGVRVDLVAAEFTVDGLLRALGAAATT